MKYETLAYYILDWAKQRDLIKQENAPKQFLKVAEELGELASAIAKKDEEEIADAIGDTLVTLIILSAQLEFDPIACLNIAWDEIKDRKGKTVNGVFIKE